MWNILNYQLTYINQGPRQNLNNINQKFWLIKSRETLHPFSKFNNWEEQGHPQLYLVYSEKSCGITIICVQDDLPCSCAKSPFFYSILAHSEVIKFNIVTISQLSAPELITEGLYWKLVRNFYKFYIYSDLNQYVQFRHDMHYFAKMALFNTQYIF